MHAAVGDLEHSALIDGHVLAALLGILDYPVLALRHDVKQVLHRRAEPLEDLRDVKLVQGRELRFFQEDDVGWLHSCQWSVVGGRLWVTSYVSLTTDH